MQLVASLVPGTIFLLLAFVIHAPGKVQMIAQAANHVRMVKSLRLTCLAVSASGADTIQVRSDSLRVKIKTSSRIASIVMRSTLI